LILQVFLNLTYKDGLNCLYWNLKNTLHLTNGNQVIIGEATTKISKEEMHNGK